MLKGEVRSSSFGKVFYRQPPERYSEVGTVKRVNEWIDGRIDPPDPREILHYRRVHVICLQERRQQVEYEERQPANDKAANDDA